MLKILITLAELLGIVVCGGLLFIVLSGIIDNINKKVILWLTKSKEE